MKTLPCATRSLVVISRRAARGRTQKVEPLVLRRAPAPRQRAPRSRPRDQRAYHAARRGRAGRAGRAGGGPCLRRRASGGACGASKRKGGKVHAATSQGPSRPTCVALDMHLHPMAQRGATRAPGPRLPARRAAPASGTRNKILFGASSAARWRRQQRSATEPHPRDTFWCVAGTGCGAGARKGCTQRTVRALEWFDNRLLPKF